MYLDIQVQSTSALALPICANTNFCWYSLQNGEWTTRGMTTIIKPITPKWWLEGATSFILHLEKVIIKLMRLMQYKFPIPCVVPDGVKNILLSPLLLDTFRMVLYNKKTGQNHCVSVRFLYLLSRHRVHQCRLRQVASDDSTSIHPSHELIVGDDG